MQSGEASVQGSAEEGSTEEESSAEEEEKEKPSKVSMAAYKPYIGNNVMVCIKKNWWVEKM